MTYTLYTYGALAFLAGANLIGEVISGAANITMAKALWSLLTPSVPGCLFAFMIGTIIACGKAEIPNKVCIFFAWVAGGFLCKNKVLEGAPYRKRLRRVIRKNKSVVMDI